ncbi:MAG: HPr Serine kinase C-terminal domain [Chloroflexota bacterium]|nr:HPr Serine kinase C-terminal domain [Chloroflexota bacterium]
MSDLAGSVTAEDYGCLELEKESRWLRAPEWQCAIERQDAAGETPVCFQLGEGLLQISTADHALLHAFRQLYADCEIPSAAVPTRLGVRCEVRRGVNLPLILLTFTEGGPTDLATAALPLLDPPTDARYHVVSEGPMPGWRSIASPADGARPVLVARGHHLLIDPELMPADVIVACLVSVTLAAQPQVAVIHSASLRLGDAGVLLIGPSGAGKTTTALSLAARGHTLLGDELAAIRLATAELVPFPRAAHRRAGPRTPELAAAFNGLGGRAVAAAEAGWSGLIRVRALCPGSCPTVKLRAAFFLSEFADRPSISPFRLTMRDDEIFSYLAGNTVAYASWGLVPARRVLRLLALKEVLARVPSWQLKVGPPAETAKLIESAMEER